jgi:non-canonical poly(A) RNA polymerase PAPD5/7
MGKAERWTIIDPNNPDNDLSVGSSQARLIQKKFSESHADLVRLMKTLDTAGFVLRKGQSFLRLIIGGNYEKVILQRNVMRGVHQTTLDPI